MAEYIVAIDVARVRFPADAHSLGRMHALSVCRWGDLICGSTTLLTLGKESAPQARTHSPGRAFWGRAGRRFGHKRLCIHLKQTISSIGGLVAEYIVAIDVTRARFPAGAHSRGRTRALWCV